MPIDEETGRSCRGEDSTHQSEDFANRQSEDFASKTGARKFCVENREWLDGTCRHAMWQTDCPTPSRCGQELCQEQLISSGRVKDDTWSGVAAQKKYYFTIVRRAAVQKKKECGCGVGVDIEDAHELDELIAETRPGEAWKDALQMDDAILFREVVEHLDKDEQTLLSMMAEGYQSPAIARELGIEAGAVRKRKERLFKKLKKLFSDDTGEVSV